MAEGRTTSITKDLHTRRPGYSILDQGKMAHFSVGIPSAVSLRSITRTSAAITYPAYLAPLSFSRFSSPTHGFKLVSVFSPMDDSQCFSYVIQSRQVYILGTVLEELDACLRAQLATVVLKIPIKCLLPCSDTVN